MKIYLSGASKIFDDEGEGWRLKAEEMFNEYGICVFSPNAHYNYSTLIPDTNKECKSLFIHHLRTSDVVLVNLQQTIDSPGTAQETILAHELKIPVVGFCDYNAYPWVVEDCDVILETLKDAVEYIKLHY